MPTIGSSDIAAVIGRSPWAGPWDVWARMTGLLPRYDTATGSQLRGQILEPAIRMWYAGEVGAEIVHGPTLTMPGLPIEDFGHARHDGLFRLGGRLYVHEIKTTRDWYGWGDAGTGDVPVYYAAQAAWQAIAVSDHEGEPVAATHLTAFNAIADELRVYIVPRDPKVEAALLAAGRVWYDRHIRCGQMPDVDASNGCVAAMSAMYLRPTKEWLEPTDEHLALAADARAAKAEVDAATERFNLAKNTLCQHIGNAYGIRGVARWQPSKKGRSFYLLSGENDDE